jgi:hypothetical protein
MTWAIWLIIATWIVNKLLLNASCPVVELSGRWLGEIAISSNALRAGLCQKAVPSNHTRSLGEGRFAGV